jgi:HTH-type transcriptional regulator / antitoxin HipB
MKITSPKRLAIFLKDLRRTQKLTQADIAKRVGIRQDTISKFENNPDTTQIETFFKIISALNLEFHLEQRDEIRKSGEWKEEW